MVGRGLRTTRGFLFPRPTPLPHLVPSINTGLLLIRARTGKFRPATLSRGTRLAKLPRTLRFPYLPCPNFAPGHPHVSLSIVTHEHHADLRMQCKWVADALQEPVFRAPSLQLRSARITQLNKS